MGWRIPFTETCPSGWASTKPAAIRITLAVQ
jgi:hypothetical protein